MTPGARLLDGSTGRELRLRGVPLSDTIWSASALLVAPDVVRQVHADYIAAGADVITTNSYGVTRRALARAGIEARFAELVTLAGRLAAEARQEAGRPVAIAGCLPPLCGSYRPDLVGPFAEIEPLYREQAELLAPWVDLFLCETMSSAAEAVAAATAAARLGKPVWVAFTLAEDRSGRLRSGETVTAAAARLDPLPVEAVLANCSAPESIETAMPELVALRGRRAGGYANAFQPVPADWTLDGRKPTDGLLALREDLDPERYAGIVGRWLAEGAGIVGGCCGIGPAHIRRLRALLD